MPGMGRFQGAGRSRTKPHMIHTTKHSHQPRRALDTRPPECRRALHGAFGFDGSVGSGKAQEGFTSFKGLSEGFRRL